MVHHHIVGSFVNITIGHDRRHRSHLFFTFWRSYIAVKVDTHCYQSYHNNRCCSKQGAKEYTLGRWLEFYNRFMLRQARHYIGRQLVEVSIRYTKVIFATHPAIQVLFFVRHKAFFCISDAQTFKRFNRANEKIL